MEIIELSNTKVETKNSPGRLSGRWRKQDRIDESEDRSIAFILKGDKLKKKLIIRALDLTRQK